MRMFMNLVLVLALLGGVIMGLNALGNARSAVHEIEGFICFLIATVAAAGLGISAAVDDVVRRLPEPVKPAASEPPKVAAG